MYKVIKHFIDLHDNDHSYNEGDIFPREGVIRKIQKNTVLLFLEKQQGKEILKKKRTDMIRAMQHMR